MQQFDLRNGCRDIRGIGIGHRLHHDGCAAAEGDTGDINAMPVFAMVTGLVHGFVQEIGALIVKNIARQ